MEGSNKVNEKKQALFCGVAICGTKKSLYRVISCLYPFPIPLETGKHMYTEPSAPIIQLGSIQNVLIFRLLLKITVYGIAHK